MKKTAIVTGGSRGIGFAVAERLGRDGYNIAIIDMNDKADYKDNFLNIKTQGTDYLYFKGNICSEEDRDEFIGLTVEKFGGIHVLVNNAGVAPRVRADILEMTEESFDRVVEINTKGNMFMTQAVVRQMLKQPVEGKKRGAVINVSSCSSVVSSTGRGEYCVSKAGVSMLTTLYADRLASDAIFVNEVRPGVIATEMTGAVKDKYNKMFEEGVFPIARWGTPEDVANAVAALVGDDFLYTTGNYIDIDGGFHIKRL